MDFEKILDKILNKLNEYQVRGSFVFDIDNLENIDKVNDIIEEVLKKEGYYDNIKEYRKVFDENLKDIISQYKSFGTINTRSLKAFNNVAFDNFYNNLAVNVTDTNIKQPIKDALLQYVAGGGKYNDFKSTVKDILTTKKIEGNIDIVAREYSTQYKRAQGQILANKFNVQYFRYSGTEIETSRCFCDKRIGNIYTKKEIESWADLEWSGKIKGTNSTNIFQVAGGWNCRHNIRPVSEKLALSYGLNKYNNTDCTL
jgi:hypothetical protein